jgi:hypothetical protein
VGCVLSQGRNVSCRNTRLRRLQAAQAGATIPPSPGRGGGWGAAEGRGGGGQAKGTGVLWWLRTAAWSTAVAAVGAVAWYAVGPAAGGDGGMVMVWDGTGLPGIDTSSVIALTRRVTQKGG